MLIVSIPLLFFDAFLWSNESYVRKTMKRVRIYSIHAYVTCWTHNDRQKCGKVPQLHPPSQGGGVGGGGHTNEAPAHRRVNIWRQTSIHRHIHTCTFTSLHVFRLWEEARTRETCMHSNNMSPLPGPQDFLVTTSSSKLKKNIWTTKCDL